MYNIISDLVSKLNVGATIIYPTDTVWGLGCKADIYTAFKKINEIKNRDIDKKFILLFDSLSSIKKLIEIPYFTENTILNTTSPTSYIINASNSILPKFLLSQDNTIAIRISNCQFNKELIYKLNYPLISTSANISGTQTAKTFVEIDSKIIDKVDIIVPEIYDTGSHIHSKILKIEDKNIFVVRK